MLQLILRQLEVFGGLNGQPVEAIGVFDQRGILAAADIGEDVGYCDIDGIILRIFKSQELVETGTEIGIGGIESFYLNHGMNGFQMRMAIYFFTAAENASSTG